MDRFEAMRASAQVVERGSFTQAAHQLGLHKATVSQQIQLLEERVGARLLNRPTRAVAPTAEGYACHHRTCAILQQVDEAESALRTGTHAPAGHLRVDVPVAIGRLVLVPEVRDLLDCHPKITLEPGCTDCVVDLVQEGLDGIVIIQVADFVACHQLASGALLPVLPGWQRPALPLHLVTPTTHRCAVRVQVFMDWAQGLLLRRLGAHMVRGPR